MDLGWLSSRWIEAGVNVDEKGDFGLAVIRLRFER
jgi:hypothetical protein